jgi:hypothetical protein
MDSSFSYYEAEASEATEGCCPACVMVVWNAITSFFLSLWECVMGSSEIPVTQQEMTAKGKESIDKHITLISQPKTACIVMLDGQVIAVHYASIKEDEVDAFLQQAKSTLEAVLIDKAPTSASDLWIHILGMETAEEGTLNLSLHGSKISSRDLNELSRGTTGLTQQDAVQKLMEICNVTAETLDKDSSVSKMIRFLTSESEPLKTQGRNCIIYHAKEIQKAVSTQHFAVAVLFSIDGQRVGEFRCDEQTQETIQGLDEKAYSTLSDVVEQHPGSTLSVTTLLIENQESDYRIHSWTDTDGYEVSPRLSQKEKEEYLATFR